MLRQLITAGAMSLILAIPVLGFVDGGTSTSLLKPIFARVQKTQELSKESQSEQSLNSIVTMSQFLGDNILMARALNDLANLYITEGRRTDAEEAYKMSIKAYEQARGRNDIAVGLEYARLAALYAEEGRYDLAEKTNVISLDKLRDTQGNQCIGVAVALNNQGWLKARRGAYAEAEKDYSTSLEIFKRRLGKNHILVGTTAISLADVLAHEKKYAQAEKMYDSALKLLVGRLEDEETMSDIVKNYARVLGRDKKHNAAHKLYADWGLLMH